MMWGAVAGGAIITLSITMLVAILGRAWDWSPWALVLSGAAVGWIVAATAILYAYANGADE